MTTTAIRWTVKCPRKVKGFLRDGGSVELGCVRTGENGWRANPVTVGVFW